ncbi:MAG: stage II sporulation protein M, partial [Candidatus Aenigmatarchaeota archaeon]
SVSHVFKEHNRLIVFYVFLFFGMALEYMLLFAMLPPVLGDAAFSSQLALMGPAGQFSAPEAFVAILGNNLMILIIAFALSIFFGAGSIFVLNYNASIAGMLYGSAFRTLIWGAPPVATNLVLFLPHTILEVLAYLLAAVGGGILVRGLDRENIRDAGVLFIVSLMVLILAAWVEVLVML